MSHWNYTKHFTIHLKYSRKIFNDEKAFMKNFNDHDKNMLTSLSHSLHKKMEHCQEPVISKLETIEHDLPFDSSFNSHQMPFNDFCLQ